MTKEQAATFIRNNSHRMSTASLSEETGLGATTITSMCQRWGIEIITQMEERLMFLRDWRGKMSRQRVKKILGLKTDDQLLKLLRRAGVPHEEYPDQELMYEQKEGSKERKIVNLSAREILSGYQFDNRLHHNENTDPIDPEGYWLRY